MPRYTLAPYPGPWGEPIMRCPSCEADDTYSPDHVEHDDGCPLAGVTLARPSRLAYRLWAFRQWRGQAAYTLRQCAREAPAALGFGDRITVEYVRGEWAYAWATWDWNPVNLRWRIRGALRHLGWRLFGRFRTEYCEDCGLVSRRRGRSVGDHADCVLLPF